MAQWLQYDSTNKLLKRSINNGSSFANLELDAAQISQGTFADARIPSLAASKITSGTFDVARIPDLAASKITSGTMATARLGSGTADATKFLRGDQTWQVFADPANYLWLQLFSDESYNDGLNHSVAVAINDRMGVIVVSTTSGSIQKTYIPFCANGGSGVAFRWAYLHPTAGWQANVNGTTASFQDAGAVNTYVMILSSGSGDFDIQRTAGSTAYNVKIYRF